MIKPKYIGIMLDTRKINHKQFFLSFNNNNNIKNVILKYI